MIDEACNKDKFVIFLDLSLAIDTLHCLGSGLVLAWFQPWTGSEMGAGSIPGPVVCPTRRWPQEGGGLRAEGLGGLGSRHSRMGRTGELEGWRAGVLASSESLLQT